jgi:hypothetical protein
LTNGKVQLIGLFTKLDGVDRRHIGRLNADGSVDAADATLWVVQRGMVAPHITVEASRADVKRPNPNVAIVMITA